MKLGELVSNFSTRNANSYTTKEEIEQNFIIPSGPLHPKFVALYNRIKSFENTLIFGARGVGKTLYLKKTKYDYLYSNQEIFPIYIDLTYVRDLFKATTEMKFENVKKRQLFTYYLRFLIVSELTNLYGAFIDTKNQSLWNRFKGIFVIISEMYGIQKPKIQAEEAREKITAMQNNLANPFDLTNIGEKGFEFKDTIHELIQLPKFKVLMEKEYLEILKSVSESTKITKFLLIFDEFSMLPPETQNILAPAIISLSGRTKSHLDIKSKISIMEGRFHVNTEDYNFVEHDFSELHFEEEFKSIFSKQAAEERLLNFYTNILKQRIKKDKIMMLFEDQIAFRNLCLFSGFKIRDFLAFIHDICEIHSSESIITQDYVYEVCSKFYQKQLPRFLQKVDSAVIDDYLRQLGKFLKNSQNKFYFISEDFNEPFFQVLLYYKIISFVEYLQRSSDLMVDTRGFLLDLSTALQLGIISKAKLKNLTFKYLNFSNGRAFTYNPVDKRTEQIVINLLETGHLADKQILEAVQLGKEEFKKIKDKLKFNKNYDSESLVDEDPQVDEDEDQRKKINDLAQLKFITIERASFLVTKGVTKELFMGWKKIELEKFYRENDIPGNFRSGITRAFNYYHN